MSKRYYFAPDGHHSYISEIKPESNGRAQLFTTKLAALEHLNASLAGELMQHETWCRKFRLALDEAAAELALEQAKLARSQEAT